LVSYGSNRIQAYTINNAIYACFFTVYSFLNINKNCIFFDPLTVSKTLLLLLLVLNFSTSITTTMLLMAKYITIY